MSCCFLCSVGFKQQAKISLPHWSTLWNGPPFVIYGHTPREEVARTKWTLGIDTACVLGGSLTAYVLPEKKIVQVKARETYYKA